MTEEMKAYIERQQMIQESMRYDIQRLFDELTEEQLTTVGFIFHGIVADNDPCIAAYYEGVVNQTIALKFGQALLAAEPHPEVLDAHNQPSLFADARLTDEDIKNMKLYNLDDLRDEETEALIGFICKGCGMQYVSIQDRMLRAADTCGGCIQKAKWG